MPRGAATIEPVTVPAYEADGFEKLEGLDHVRARPGMYVGGTNVDGLHHLLWEVVDNAVDEANAGYGTRIEVELHNDGSVTVVDHGRGIPVEKHAQLGVTVMEGVFAELAFGGKFNHTSYAASGGLNGVGSAVVNALSLRLDMEVDRGGKTHRLSFRQRIAGHFDRKGAFAPSHEPEIVGNAKTTGTRVRFWPEYALFEDGAAFDPQRIAERLSTMAHLLPGVTFSLRHDGATTEYHSKAGLADLLEKHQTGRPVTDLLHWSDTLSYEEKVPGPNGVEIVTRSARIDVLAQWTNGFEGFSVSYANIIPTWKGGVHLDATEKALAKAIADLTSGQKKLAKLAKDGRDKPTRDDILEGCTLAVRVQFPAPQFRDQTKSELTTPAIRKLVTQVVADGFAAWLKTGKKVQHEALKAKVTDAIVSRQAQRDRLDERRAVSKAASSATLPDKLADCANHGPDSGSELILCEGDSASGPCKAGRSAVWQAILPLRGKVLNTHRADTKRVLANAELQAITSAIGAGLGRDFDPTAIRYQRVVILTDADKDGNHIRCLLLTFFHNYMPQLIEQGRIFAAEPPLYAVRSATRGGSDVVYCYTDAEKDKLVTRLGNRKHTVARFKGLGEMDTDELAEAALDPTTRTLRQITMKDATSAAAMFETLMGSEVGPRRAHIEDRALTADLDV